MQCLVIARCAGNKEASFSDFLIYKEATEVQADTPEKLAKDLMRFSGGVSDGE